MDARITILVLTLSLCACALQRAEIAQTAQSKMVGMSREQVLACMGPPSSKMAEGQTEVWQYVSGNGHTSGFGTASANTNATAFGTSNWASGQANTTVETFTTSSRRFCSVQVVMSGGVVSRLNYAGPTGGLLTQGEQCAFAVENCVK